MRVPSYRMQQNMVHVLHRASGRIENIHRQIATGKRLHKPSDDPAGVVKAMSLRKLLEDNNQFRRNIDDALVWNQATEVPLTSIVELLTQMKEAATDGANDALDDGEYLGSRVDGLLEDLFGASQARVDDRYVFSGYRTSSPPYEAGQEVLGETLVAGALNEAVDLVHARVASGSVSVTDTSGTGFVEGVDYSIDYDTGRLTILGSGSMVPGETYLVDYETDTISSVVASEPIEGEHIREIGVQRTVAVNLTGPEVFEGGIDLFQLGIDLKNALWKDDRAAVRALMDSIDEAINHVGQMLGVVGVRAQTLNQQASSLETDEVTLQKYIAEVEDVDIAEASIQLQAEQNAYEAALAAASRLLNVSIVNYL